MSISEQVKELREEAEYQKDIKDHHGMAELLSESADTIESLSAKLKEYEYLEDKLKNEYHANIGVKEIVKNFIETIFKGVKHEGFLVLTNEDAEMYCKANMERSADGSGWIPCSERLPDEPETLPTEDDFIERMILDGEFEEYNVTIYGAEKATTLYYIGNGSWYDELSNECYKVIAWQPLPESYRGKEQEKS